MWRSNPRNAWYNDLIERYDFDSDESLDDFGPDLVLVDPNEEDEPEAAVQACTKPSLLPIFSSAANGAALWHEYINDVDTFFIAPNTSDEQKFYFFIPFMVNEISRGTTTRIYITIDCNKKWRPRHFLCMVRNEEMPGTGTTFELTNSPMTGPFQWLADDRKYVVELRVHPEMLDQFGDDGVNLLPIQFHQKQTIGFQSALYKVTEVVSYLPMGYKVRWENFFTFSREAPEDWTTGAAAEVFDVPVDQLGTIYRFQRTPQQPFIKQGPPLKMVGRPQFGNYMDDLTSAPFEQSLMLTPGSQNTEFVSIWPVQPDISNSTDAAYWESLVDFYNQPRLGTVLKTHDVHGCKVYGCYVQQYVPHYVDGGYRPPLPPPPEPFDPPDLELEPYGSYVTFELPRLPIVSTTTHSIKTNADLSLLRCTSAVGVTPVLYIPFLTNEESRGRIGNRIKITMRYASVPVFTQLNCRLFVNDVIQDDGRNDIRVDVPRTANLPFDVVFSGQFFDDYIASRNVGMNLCWMWTAGVTTNSSWFHQEIMSVETYVPTGFEVIIHPMNSLSYDPLFTPPAFTGDPNSTGLASPPMPWYVAANMYRVLTPTQGFCNFGYIPIMRGAHKLLNADNIVGGMMTDLGNRLFDTYEPDIRPYCPAYTSITSPSLTGFGIGANNTGNFAGMIQMKYTPRYED